MKKILLLLICCQLFLSACSDQGSKGSLLTTDATGITGGQKVVVDSKLSRMVVLVDSAKRSEVGIIKEGVEVFPIERFLCTGTFIDENIILTAAHCIKKAPFRMRIMYSEDSLNKNARHSVIEQVIIHEGYVEGAKTSTNDIALIKIQGVRPSDYAVSSITTTEETKENFPLLSIGYGITGSNLDDGGILRRVNTMVTGYSALSPTFEIDQSSGAGICQGDSGGPGFILKDGKFAVLGIAASVYGFVDEKEKFACKHFGVYTNTIYHAGWILKSVKKLNGADGAQ